MHLETARLTLRPFRAVDLDAFAAINADPEVMRHFPATLDRDETLAAMRRYEAHRAAHGFAMSALEERATGRFLGVVGLQRIPFDAPFTPAVEVGWRIERAAWGRGLASEAARAAVDWGFGPGGFAEIVAVTLADNQRSRAVMERLGMTRDPVEDFDHPLVPIGHPMRRHVLYRLRRSS
ncbi:MAG: GNAT family N-acetyltransferase [Hyphomicrobiales bacterium]|nr:GNAT family N-acetyltransferase [Hyphomicrobiales bacterium]